MTERPQRGVAVPGEKLSVIEEYVAGEGTYEEGGQVFAKLVGEVEVDSKDRKIAVSPIKERAIVPIKGDIVVAQVQSIKEDVANVRILAIEGRSRLAGFFSGVLHVSQAGGKHLRSVGEALAVADIIRAKVIADWPPYQLSIADRDLGVTYALCLKCGEPLILHNGKLYCKKCKQYEKRKVSSRYVNLVRRNED